MELIIRLELLPETEARLGLESDEYLISDLKLLLVNTGEILDYSFIEKDLTEFDETVKRVKEAFDGEAIDIPGDSTIYAPKLLKEALSNTLNEDQMKAIEELSDWYINGHQVIILTGGGGTGKTYAIAEWLEVQKEACPLFIAPTHEAKRVLKASLQRSDLAFEVNTVSQFLGKQPIIDEKTGKQSFRQSKSKIVNDTTDNESLVICDEASMVSAEDYDEILFNCKRIIFIGDKAQLPPVGEKASPVFAKSWQQISLSKVMRSNGHLSEEATKSREASLSDQTYIPTKGEGVEYISSRDAMILGEELFRSEDYKENVNFCRFLAFTNKTVDALNHDFRVLLGLPSPFVKGNKLKCYKPVTRPIMNDAVYSSESRLRFRVLANNSEVVEVLSEPTSSSIEGFVEEISLLSGLDISETFVSLLPGKSIEFKASTSESLDYQAMVLSPGATTLKEDLIIKLRKDLKSNKWQKKSIKLTLKCLYNLGDSYKDLYASTVHKSQGSSIDHCFVLLDDLLRARDMKPALLYTAFSRASKKLYIIKD